MGEERDHGLDGAAAECIVAEVDLDEGGLVLERVADGRERLRNFGNESAGEDVCEIRDLWRVVC